MDSVKAHAAGLTLGPRLKISSSTHLLHPNHLQSISMETVAVMMKTKACAMRIATTATNLGHQMTLLDGLHKMQPADVYLCREPVMAIPTVSKHVPQTTMVCATTTVIPATSAGPQTTLSSKTLRKACADARSKSQARRRSLMAVSVPIPTICSVALTAMSAGRPGQPMTPRSGTQRI